MKSLKRTLSLVLALVMVLGLFGGISMTAAASDFSDDDEIQYKEAVDVMTGIGAIDGMGDGTFKPKDTITRAQAAKLVAYTVLGKAAAERLPIGVTSRYSDVDANFAWAAPSIEYLANAGVIDGMGDGTFHPNDPITGYAIGKMLLCALGYGAKGEFTGTGWDLQVAIYGSIAKSGIFADTKGDVNLSNNATREEVALYCFNTIQRATVEYYSTLDVYVKNKTNLDGGTEEDVTLMNTIYTGLEKVAPLGTSSAANGSVAGKTAFGDPAKKWVYNKKVLGTYVQTPVYTTTEKQLNSDMPALAAELRNINVVTNTTSYPQDTVLNGYNSQGAFVANLKTMSNGSLATTAADGVSGNLNKLIGMSGNGNKISVYADNGVVTAITLVRSYIAVVADKNPATGVTLTATSNIGFTGYYMTASGTSATYRIAPTDNLYGVVAGLSLNDRVLITPLYNGSAWVVSAVSIPEKVTGKITSVIAGADPTDADLNKIVVDGDKTYELAENRSTAPIKADANEDMYIWLDQYGYVMDVARVEDSNKYEGAKVALIYGTGEKANMETGDVYEFASVVFADGTTADVNIGPVGTARDTIDTSYINGGPKPAFYTVSDEGVYTFDTAGDVDQNPTTAADVTASKPTLIPLKASGTIDAGDLKLDTDIHIGTSLGASNGYTNNYSSDIKFISVDSAKGDGNAPWSVTGVAEGRSGAKADDTNGKISYALIDRSPTNSTKYVVTAIWLVDGELTGAADTKNLVYTGSDVVKLGTTSVAGTSSATAVNIYKVWINGEETELYTTDTITNAHVFFKRTPTTKVTIEGKDIYTLTPTTDGIKTGTADTDSFDNFLNITGDASYDVSEAVVKDTRTGAKIAAKPLGNKGITTGRELVEAIGTMYSNFSVSVIISDANATPVKVSTIYIYDAGTKLNEVKLNNTSFTLTENNGNTYGVEIVGSNYVPISGGTIKLKITAPDVVDTSNSNPLGAVKFLVNGTIQTVNNVVQDTTTALGTGNTTTNAAGESILQIRNTSTAKGSATVNITIPAAGAGPMIITMEEANPT